MPRREYREETIFRFRNERGRDITIGITYQKETIVDEETIYRYRKERRKKSKGISHQEESIVDGETLE